jgi:ribosomal protein L7/L12
MIDVSLNVSPDVYTKLTALAESLSRNLGFQVTTVNTIGWLLRQHEEWTDSVKEEPEPTPSWHAEAEALMRDGKKINAIKLARERTGWGLKDAKDFVESKWQHLVPSLVVPRF